MLETGLTLFVVAFLTYIASPNLFSRMDQANDDGKKIFVKEIFMQGSEAKNNLFFTFKIMNEQPREYRYLGRNQTKIIFDTLENDQSYIIIDEDEQLKEIHLNSPDEVIDLGR